MKINLIYMLLIITLISQNIDSDSLYKNGRTIFKISPMTVLEPGKIRFQNTYNYYDIQNLKASILTNELEYALSKHQTVQITTPLVLNYKRHNENNKQGIGKIQLHTDFRWYIQKHFASVLRFGIELPTTNIKNSTLLGFNSTNIFLRLENVFLSKNWFFDFIAGPLITTKAHNKQQGKQFLHFIDFAKIFSINTTHSPFTLFTGITFYGTFVRPNSFNNILDPNSGFYILTLGPLVSFSNSSFLIDFRGQFPIVQRLFGNESKLNYVLSTSLQLLF